MDKTQVFYGFVNIVKPIFSDPNAELAFVSICEILDSLQWIPQHFRDDNRVQDAKDLISDMNQSGGFQMEYYQNYIPSLFQIMVALAYRMERPDLHIDALGDRTSLWFHWMLLSLMGNDNATYDDMLINNELYYRAYNYAQGEWYPDGKYSLFYIPGFDGDLRTVELWRQKDVWIAARGIR